MRRPEQQATVRWSTYITKEQATELSETWPINGFFTALVVVSLEKFLAQVETNESVKDQVITDIYRHLSDSDRSTYKHQLSIRIPQTLYDRFNAILPGFGATTWFLRRVLEEFLSTQPTFEQLVVSSTSSLLADVTRPSAPTSFREQPNAV